MTQSSSRFARMIVLTLACASGLAGGAARAAGADQGPVAARPQAAPAPRLNLSMLAGVAVPACTESVGCVDLGPGASLAGAVLYQATDALALGLTLQASWFHWSARFVSPGGGRGEVKANVLTGFAGAAARISPWPELLVSPILQLALGASIQAQTDATTGCEKDLVPTGQLGLGGQVRLARSTSAFVLASGTWGIKGASCVVFDAPSIPFSGWGLGVLAGASFDVHLGSSSSGTALAVR